jgi:cellulose synthase/poly-beta-1,6-N-acetylglucosamine synthase-like glycosyltransferase
MSLLFIYLVKFSVARWHYYKRKRGRIPQYEPHEYSVLTEVPYAGEEAQFFEQALRSCRAQEGLASHKIYVLMDGMGDMSPNDEASLRAAEKYADRIFIGNYKKKRFNLEYMTTKALEAGDSADVLHLMDSDTYFPTTDVGYRMTQPFADPKMGGGTTAQTAHRRDTSAERTGDLLEHARIGLSLAASNETRGIPCLPGRSIWLRMDAVVPHMKGLNEEHWGMWVPKLHSTFPYVLKWMNVECYAGDDRYLTDWLHIDGWDTFFDPEAKVETLLGEFRKKMYLQWWRWCTTSQHSTGRRGHLLFPKKPFAFLYHLSDTYAALAAVFLMWSWVLSILFRNEEAFWPLSLMLVGSAVSMAGMLILKNLAYFKKYPKDLWSVWLFLMDIAVGVHIRVLALFTPWRVRTWGSRRGVDDKTEKKFIREHFWKH